MTIANIRTVAPSLDDARAMVKARALDLLRTLGSGGREVLGRNDTNDLMWWLMHTGTMSADELASFASVERHLAKRFAVPTLRSVAHDGEQSLGRDRRQQPKAVPTPKAIEPAPTYTGNVTAFPARRVRRHAGNPGPRAA
jgi:hypothetical protein